MICVDASVAVKWVLQEELSEQARALYLKHLRMRDPIVASSLLLYEVTNTLRQQLRKPHGMSLMAARRALADVLASGVAFHSMLDMHDLALTIADIHDLPAAYDAQYLALSDLLGCEFWTADQRLLRQVGDRLSYVRALAEFTTSAT